MKCNWNRYLTFAHQQHSDSLTLLTLAPLPHGGKVYNEAPLPCLASFGNNPKAVNIKIWVGRSTERTCYYLPRETLLAKYWSTTEGCWTADGLFFFTILNPSETYGGVHPAQSCPSSGRDETAIRRVTALPTKGWLWKLEGVQLGKEKRTGDTSASKLLPPKGLNDPPRILRVT